MANIATFEASETFPNLKLSTARNTAPSNGRGANITPMAVSVRG